MCDVEFTAGAAEIGLDARRARDPTCTPSCRTVGSVSATGNGALEPSRRVVVPRHRPNPLTSAVGGTTVANSRASSAVLPVCAGLYVLQTLVARLPEPAARAFHIRAAWWKHARSHVPGQDEDADERLPFMAAASGSRYSPPCRCFTFPGKSASVKDRMEAFDRLACESGAPCLSEDDPAVTPSSAPGHSNAHGVAPPRT
jgi:hypothetical protein